MDTRPWLAGRPGVVSADGMPESIVIGAALAHRAGYGGHAWALFQYVLGFRELGFDVTVVDRLEPGMGDDDQAALAHIDGLLAANRIPYCVLGADGRWLARSRARRHSPGGQTRASCST